MLQNETNRSWQSLLVKLPEQIKDKYLEKLYGYAGLAKGAGIPALDEYFKNVTRLKAENPVIYIGAGTCGLAAGADKTAEAVRRFSSDNNMNVELVDVGCIGYCAVEPIIDVKLPGKKRVVFHSVTEDKVDEILGRLLKGELASEHLLGEQEDSQGESWQGISSVFADSFFKHQTRRVLKNCGVIDPANLEEYLAGGGYGAYLYAIHNMTSAEVCKLIKESGLRGRGGGGFPAGIKWEIAHEQNSPVKYMVCNADEGDPGAFMDRAVIEGDPHRLIEGLAIAAYAIGSEYAYIYIRAEYPLAIERLISAIDQAKKMGLIGSNIMDSGVSLEIKIKKGAGAFVCGEETALIHSIEGKRGMPRPRPPFPAVSGLFNRPTIINNVETLANVPDIVAMGKEWFTAIGTENSKGTKVFALSGKVNRTGLIEVAMGTSIRQILFDIGGGIPNGKAFKAVQIGGPSGGCLTDQHLDILVDYDSLKTVGAMMGSGGLVVMDQDNCMVDVAKFFMEFIQKESCGKCIPCREGTKRIWQILNSITRHRRDEVENSPLERFQGILQLEKLSGVIREASLCGLGKTAANPVLSTLRWFREEYETHVFERKCPTLTCTDMVSYSIDRDACKGCMLCLKNCPVNAIMGEKKTPHYIIQEKCTGCGNCRKVCKFSAVAIA